MPVIDWAASVQRFFRRHETLGRLRREQHIGHHLLLGDAACFCLLRNLLLHQRRHHIAGAHCIDGDAVFGNFERCRLGEAGNAVLGGDIGRLEGRRDQRMGRGDIDDAAPALRLHMRNGEARGVEGARQVDGDDRIPFLDRKFLDRRDELDARIVDEDIDAAELFCSRCHHAGDGCAIGHVGAVIDDLHIVQAGEFGADVFYLVGIAEAVEHHIGALRSEAARDAKTDATCRAGDDRGFSGQHGDDFQ
jgi:hypothetical protein